MKYRCRPMLEKDMTLVMRWRMDPEITKYMNTNPKLTLKSQLNWFKKMSEDKHSFYWIIEVDNQPVGVASINNIDYVNKTCSRGTYIGVKEKRTMELFATLYCNQYDFIFYTLHMNKVETEIFAENVFVVELNKRLGNVQEGYLRQHIKKEGKYYDVVKFGMLKEEWDCRRQEVQYQPMDIIITERESIQKIVTED